MLFTSTVFNPNVTTHTISSVKIRNPATISCTVLLSATPESDTTVAITWSKDGRQLHNNTELMITSSNETAISLQSNLTIHVLETSDSGLYSCQVALVSKSTLNPISSPAISTLHLEVKGAKFTDVA